MILAMRTAMSTAAPPGLRDWPAFQLFKCGWWIEQRVEQALEPLGLRGRHFMVLTMLGADPSLSQQQMATYMSLDPTPVVALIDDLEREGLCERGRDPDDRRRNVVRLTTKGRQRLRRARAVVADIDADLLAPLSETERAKLAELISRVMEPYWSEKLVPPRRRA
jgi:DNA-binding MarR family transcriptional regulator